MAEVTLQQVLEALGKATPGGWMLATSCSWRRVLTEDGKAVIVPITQRSDGHPDLDAGPDHINAEAAILAVNWLRANAERLRDYEALLAERDAFKRDALMLLENAQAAQAERDALRKALVVASHALAHASESNPVYLQTYEHCDRVLGDAATSAEPLPERQP